MRQLRSSGLFVLAFLGLMAAGCGGGGAGNGDNNPAIRSISGSVTSSGRGVKGAAIKLSGAASATVFTNTTGNYSFAGLANGHYTVTPDTAQLGYTESPKAITQTVDGVNIPHLDFTAKATVFYVSDEAGRLGMVNLASQEVQLIGNTGAVVMGDIAMDPNGNLYGISTDKLYRIDKITGAATLIGDLGFSGATSLVFKDNGKLYTADNFLRTVNLVTGAATVVGNGDFPYQSSGDLAFVGDQLYLISKGINDPSNDCLVKLNAATGKGTLLGVVGLPVVFGLVAVDNVTLYGFSGTKVIVVDTLTGSGTTLLDLSGKGLGNIYGATGVNN
jgi:hypothetical protein